MRKRPVFELEEIEVSAADAEIIRLVNESGVVVS